MVSLLLRTFLSISATCHRFLTFGTAAWNTMSLMGCAEVLSMDRTITSTSGRPGAGSLEKWSMALKPFLSYTVRGQMVPAREIENQNQSLDSPPI